MRWLKKWIAIGLFFVTLITPKTARGDMFGGDIAVLVQILAQAMMQLSQLKQIFSTGDETLSFLRDINEGLRDGLSVIRVINPRFNPGLYGNAETADEVLRIIDQLYGSIPQTGESRLQEAQDKSVAESIAMNGTLFRFADQVDSESKRIIEHAKDVNPQGAGKLTAQSVGLLIGVTSQVLRTNSMMLKMMSENMALQNRKEKLGSAQFKNQYQGLSSALGSLPKETKLPSLSN